MAITAWGSGQSAGFSPLLKLSAARIIAAANGYAPRAVMAVAPVVTVSSASANTTIPGATGPDGAPQYLLSDARIRKTGPVRQLTQGNNLNGYVGAWTTGSGGLFDGGAGSGLGIKTESRYVELNVSRNGKVETMALRVNNEWGKSTDYVLFVGASDFSRYQVRIDLGTVASRTVEAFLPNIWDVVGINLSPGASIALPDVSPSNVTAAGWGDSYIAAGYAGLSSVRGSFIQVLGEQMGIVDIIPEGFGGQGWALLNSGQTIGSRIVLDAPNIPAPDLNILMGSVNDYQQSVATVQAKITQGLRDLRSAHPSSWNVFLTGFKSTNGNTDQAHFDAYMAGALAAADPGLIAIDTSDLPKVQSTGLLPNGLPNDSPDDQHPGPNWIAYVVPIIKARIVAAISARAGL